MAFLLVIDDDAQIRTFVRRVLEDEGHDVREAANGWEGVNLHRSHPADLVLCDIFMPEQEGLETIRRLAGEFPGLKIVAMTGGDRYMNGRLLLHIASEFGAAAVMEKPLEPRALATTVNALLRG